MASFIARRLLYMLLVMWVASLVVFLALRITPGDPSNFVNNPVQTPERKAAIRHDLGLDKPLPEQYATFMKGIVTLHFGRTLITSEPIGTIVKNAAPNTLKLALASALIMLGLGIPLGVFAALRRNSWLDQIISGFAALSLSIPNFVLALILIRFISVQLGWLPVSGSGGIKFLILPAVVLAAEPLALTIRLMRSSVLEQTQKDYVRTLRAKGLSARRTTWMHILRNALAPIISLTTVQMRSLLGYALIVEVIFRWPGLGEALVNSVLTRDYPLAQTLSLLMVLTVIVLTFLGDIGMAMVDPRVRRRASA